MAAVVLPAAAALNLDRLGLSCWWGGGGPVILVIRATGPHLSI
jgi:hypothetical protein